MGNLFNLLPLVVKWLRPCTVLAAVVSACLLLTGLTSRGSSFAMTSRYRMLRHDEGSKWLPQDAARPCGERLLEKSHISRFRQQYLMWDEYKLVSLHDNPVPTRKTLIYNCESLCGGWADRLKGLISTYMVANLTGRAFKAQILEPHCDMKKYIVPNKVNWTITDNFTWEKNTTIKQSHTRFVNLMEGLDWGLNHRLNKTNYLNLFYPQIKHYFTRTNFDWVGGLRNSCIYQEELSWMRGLTKADIFAALYKHLFRLSPRLENQLQNKLHEELPTPEHRLVCVHVRLGHEAFHTDYARRNSMSNLPNVWRFVRNHSHSDLDKVFVMSDSQKVIEAARQQSFGKRVVAFPGVISHIDKFEYHGQTTAQACQGFERLLLEHHMLMNCDVLMMAHSGLSNFAAFIRSTDSDLYCLRDEGHIEPCSRNNFTTFR